MVKMARPWREDRGSYYMDRINETKGTRAQVLERRKTIRALYNKEPGGFDAVTPWTGASDIHIPLIMEKVEEAAPKIVSAQWRANPFVSVTLAGRKDHDAAKKVEDFLSWAHRNDIPDYYLTSNNHERTRLLDGTGFKKIYWSREWKRTIEVHTLVSTADIAGSEIGKTPGMMFQEIFGKSDVGNSLLDYKSKGKNKYKIKFTEDGRKLMADCTIRDGDRINTAEVVVRRKILINDSPKIDNVDLEHLVFPERTKTLQSAEWVAHKTWISVDELRRRKKEDGWQLTENDLKAAMGVKRLNDDEDQGEAEKDKVIGVSANTGSVRTSKDGKTDENKIPVWEIYCKERIDTESNEPIQSILFVIDKLKLVVASEFHDEVFPHGRIPFVSDVYIPIPGRVYGIGMGELLYGLNLSINKTINDINNGMTLKTTPWFMYSIFGMGDHAQLLDGIQPGEGVPVGDVNQVRFPEFAQNPAEMYHAGFETFMGHADRLTFSPSIGGSNNYRNAPRTAAGTQTLMEAAEEKLASLVEQSQAMSWKEQIRQVSSLYGQYVGVDKWFKVTGEEEPRRISPRELRENLQFEFTGSLTSVNRTIQRSLAERMYTIAGRDPLYEGDPRARQALLARFLETNNELGDIDSMIPSLPGEGDMPHAPWEQEVELHALTNGMPVEVLPVDNHEKHLAVLARFKQSKVWGTLDTNQQAVIDLHEQSHNDHMQKQIQQNQVAASQGGQGGAPTTSPGNPAEGQAAVGGELSALQGGVTG